MRIFYFILGIILGLYLLTGCTHSTGPSRPPTNSLGEYIEVCETYGAMRECYLMKKEDAAGYIGQQYEQMLWRIGR